MKRFRITKKGDILFKLTEEEVRRMADVFTEKAITVQDYDQQGKYREIVDLCLEALKK